MGLLGSGFFASVILLMREYIGQGLSKYMPKEGRGTMFGFELETMLDTLLREDGFAILLPARKGDCCVPPTPAPRTHPEARQSCLPQRRKGHYGASSAAVSIPIPLGRAGPADFPRGEELIKHVSKGDKLGAYLGKPRSSPGASPGLFTVF